MRKHFLLVLVVALHGIFVWPHVDAGSPRGQDTSSAHEMLIAEATTVHGEPSAAPFDAIPQQEREQVGPIVEAPMIAPVYQHAIPPEQEVTHAMSADDVAGAAGNKMSVEKAKAKATTGGESSKMTKKRKRKGKKVLNTETDDQTAPLFPIPALGKETSEEETTRTTTTTTTPFYVLDVPPTKAGKLYQEQEKRYWDAKEEGTLDLASTKKAFFKTKDLGLTDEERNEFRGYVRQFTNQLYGKNPKHRQHKEKYRLKRYGPSNWALKTDQQKKETRLKARRTYLMSRLNMCLEAGNRAAWTEKHDRMLQVYAAEVPPLEEGDLLLELYKDVLAANEGMERCIQLPA